MLATTELEVFVERLVHFIRNQEPKDVPDSLTTYASFRPLIHSH